MMLLLGLPLKTAYAVNMAVICLATIPGVISHYNMRHVYTRGAIVAAAGAIPGVLIGTQIAVYTPTKILKVIFGIACIGVGIYMTTVAFKKKGATPARVTLDQISRLSSGWKLWILMLLAGTATGLTGFGGGIYYMPILNALGYPMHIAIGTSSAQMIPVTAVGVTNLTLHGFQNWYFVLWVGLVTLVFSWLGARATKTMKAWVLRAIFGILIGIAGIAVALGWI
jgi:uncharacterized membrane protein YfcA